MGRALELKLTKVGDRNRKIRLQSDLDLCMTWHVSSTEREQMKDKSGNQLFLQVILGDAWVKMTFQPPLHACVDNRIFRFHNWSFKQVHLPAQLMRKKNLKVSYRCTEWAWYSNGQHARAPSGHANSIFTICMVDVVRNATLRQNLISLSFLQHASPQPRVPTERKAMPDRRPPASEDRKGNLR